MPCPAFSRLLLALNSSLSQLSRCFLRNSHTKKISGTSEIHARLNVTRQNAFPNAANTALAINRENVAMKNRKAIMLPRWVSTFFCHIHQTPTNKTMLPDIIRAAHETIFSHDGNMTSVVSFPDRSCKGFAGRCLPEPYPSQSSVGSCRCTQAFHAPKQLT